jgi:hypothetical protein
MQASVQVLGELGIRTKKPKASKRSKGRNNNPPLPNFDYSIVGATPTFALTATPDTFAPVSDTGSGNSTRDGVLNTINNGIAAFVAAKTGGGGNFVDRERNLAQGENGTGRDIGADAGRAIGNFGDTAGGIVSKHPLAVLGTVAAIVLLAINPFGGGKRGR